MPASDLHDPEDRTAAGTKIKYLYCPECGHYSGGGVCRVCERANGTESPTAGRKRTQVDRGYVPRQCIEGEGVRRCLNPATKGDYCYKCYKPGTVPDSQPPETAPQLWNIDGLRPIDEHLYKHTTIGRFGQMVVAARVNIRGVIPKGTTGRIQAKRGGVFTVRFDNGHTLVKVPYREVGIAVDY